MPIKWMPAVIRRPEREGGEGEGEGEGRRGRVREVGRDDLRLHNYIL